MERTRVALDKLNQDIMLMWGDDQHENFREDIIPPYCIAARENSPFRHRRIMSEVRPIKLTNWLVTVRQPRCWRAV
jgi:hypothetical protein